MFIKSLSEALSEIISISKEEIQALIVKNDSSEHGDFSFPCFTLSKNMKKAPNIIASELANVINLPECFLKCENVGPYLNFYVRQEIFTQYVLSEINERKNTFGSSQIGKGKTCLLEHTSINPNASPHIGRARNAIIGDFVARILKFEGYDVKVHYFVNDIGKQIAMLVWGADQLDEVKFNDLLELYVSTNNQIKDNPLLEKEIFGLLYRLENGDVEIQKKFRNIVDICISGQTKIFNELGIFYDCFDYESQFLFNNTLENIIEQIRQKGLLFEDEDGRYVVNLEKYGLTPLVITRGDKTSLYPLRDIAYTIWKCKQNADKNVIILGQDQQLYFKQVAAIVEELGYERPDVVHYAFVMLVEGKMSTRQGTVVLLEDFMREAVTKADKAIVEREKVSDIERAKKVAYSAVKYSMEKISTERNVIFDWEQALNFEGDTAPYLLYSYVRINSILSKRDDINELDINYGLLNHPTEIELINLLYDFPKAVQKAKLEYSPHVITHYAFDLAKKFSLFYHECSVLNAEDILLTNARIILIKCIKQVMENAFDILGLQLVEHM